ncbi:MAG: sulfatase-like hydrolase/transferase [Planctomycetota bacterium]
MTVRSLLGIAFVLGLSTILILLRAGTTTRLASARTRPNIVIFLADDQGWGDLSVHGNVNLSTPRIDSLARDGAIFDRFYVCPVCSPTRAEFLTGRYHARSGVTSTSAGGERFDLDERTIGEVFKSAGYATGAFGKWHSGMQWPYHPNARGFDEYYGFCSGHWGHYFDTVLEHNGELVKGNGFIIDDLTEHAMEFVEKNSDRPFFCYVPYNTPHSPMQMPDRFWEKFDGVDLKMRNRNPGSERLGHTRAALAMCENIDWNVGRMLDKLDELKLADDTIVIYFSDNGPNGSRWNDGMLGRKGSTDEGGVRVPFLIRWPGRIEAGKRVPEIAAAIDLLPTLADMAGIPLDTEKPLDGKSIKPLLTGPPAEWPDRMLIHNWRSKISARNQRFRLSMRGKLYDMVADPGQAKDVSREHPDVKRELSEAIASWKRDVEHERKRAARPFTVGHPGSRLTPLPARDGKASGTIKRSNRFPNCSFFTNWTSTGDRVTWDVEVLTSGRYEAELHYTCAAGDVGATVELAFGGESVRAKVTEAHDPPLVGAEQDRVKRAESYVKSFKTMPLGALAMEKGRGTLTLRAVDIPGRKAMDVRYVMLRRLEE